MEAIALALGWNSADGEFGFQPYHLHRSDAPPSDISIAIEFCEGARAEWRRFSFEVTHGPERTTHWTFRSAHESVTDDRSMLAWLRRQMPVLWMSEGMVSGKHADAGKAPSPDPNSLLVSRHYEELLGGTAFDVTAAIEHGSEAARQLLLSRARLRSDETTPFSELLEEMTGKHKVVRSTAPDDLLPENGTASHRLGLLLLTGALLQSGAERLEQGMSPLTLIENPEAHLHPMTLASIGSVIDRIGGQKIIATHSGILLARARLSSVRRLTRRDGVVMERRVPDGALSADELRRYSYHLRSRRAEASFARCWLLVEGETEYWMMAELARVCGYDLASEGVTCVEFAQCGLGAMLKVAKQLGIEWHLLADGDVAGERYVESVREYADTADRFTLLDEPDIEHCFWKHGYEEVFRRTAWPRSSTADRLRQASVPARKVIGRAIERYSKPWMAVLLLDAVRDRGADGIPPPLRHTIKTCVEMARRS